MGHEGRKVGGGTQCRLCPPGAPETRPVAPRSLPVPTPETHHRQTIILTIASFGSGARVGGGRVGRRAATHTFRRIYIRPAETGGYETKAREGRPAESRVGDY